jgi:DNA polymerase-4
MLRDILHLNIPAFPLAVARVSDPGLRDRPLAIAPGNSERALLQCVSAEARAEGVREGMPVYRARRFCPSLRLLLPDSEGMAKALRALAETAAAYTPLWEPVTPGRLYLDLTGSSRLLGPGRDVAARLERNLAGGLGFCGTVGVAGNKLIARIASGYLDKPGVCDVLRGSEESFIGPLPVSVLPGVGGMRAGLLEELNLRRVSEVAALAVTQLRLVCGPFASLLHQRARGLDPSPVQPPRRSPEVAEESFLPREENDDALLLAELCRLAEGCGLRLRRMGQGALKLVLTVRFADGVAEQGSTLFPRPENHDLPLMDAAEELFYRVCRRRLRVRSMRLGAGRLEGEDRQLDLFVAPPEDPHRGALQDALDRLREHYGMEAVRWGKCLS